MVTILKDVKISTCVYLAKVNTTFDLAAIFDYININEGILGIKYNNRFKGNIQKTSTFFNQASLKIFIKKHNKETNLKVFGNGLFQITGVKNDSHALHTLKIFFENLIHIKGYHTKDVVLDNGLILDKNDIQTLQMYDRFNYIKIYKKNRDDSFSLLGERRKKEFVIKGNKVTFDKDKKWFVELGHTDFTKKIYNTDGEYVGYYKYNMLYRRKNLILHNCTYKNPCMSEDGDYQKETIYNKYSKNIGERLLFIENVFENLEENITSVVINYDAIQNQDLRAQITSGDIFKSFKEKVSLSVSNINCNFQLNLQNALLNKNSVHKMFTDNENTLSYYKSDSKYQGINLKLFYDKELNMVNKTDYDYRFTVLIFQNGKVIISGCTNRLQIIKVKNFILETFNKHYEDIIIKEEVVEVKDTTLSIWDLM